MWSDELFAWSLLNDPSWRHMWRAWNLGADSGGLGFYLLCRPWLSIFGHNTIALRAFSATGVYAAFAGMWFTLRRYYRPEIVALALLVVFFGSPDILWHLVQTRFYGLLLGASSWALYLMLRSAAETKQGDPSRRSTLVLVFLINLLLVSTHPFGLFYSGLLLFSALLVDLVARRKRLAYYAAVVLSWPILLLSRTAMHNLARVGQPWFWTLKPHKVDLYLAYIPTIIMIVGVRYKYAVYAATLGILLWGFRRVLPGLRERITPIIPALVLMTAPIQLWILSQLGTSYFVDRYFLPYTLGAAILLAELLTAIFVESLRFQPKISAVLLAGSAAVLVGLVGVRILIPYGHQLVFPPKDFTGELVAMVPPGEPVVVPKADIFNMLSAYQNTPQHPVIFPFDWPLAIDPRSPKWLVSAEREVQNASLAGYFPGQIVESDQLLRDTPRFAVITDDSMQWLQIRVEAQPNWRVEKIGDFKDGFWSNSVYQVSRIQ